jgi:plastocyanin domain-containing protein
MSEILRQPWFRCLLIFAAVIAATAIGSEAKPEVQTARIEITTHGYRPANVRLRRGVLARVTFVRTTDATCAKEIVLPDFNIRRELPLNQPVVISFTPKRSGAFIFICGMNMMSGKLIVR